MRGYGRMTPNVRLYTLSTCPYCDQAKEYFSGRGIEVECTDYDLADEETQAKIQSDMEGAGARGFPFVRIGSETVEGYEPHRYSQLLGD